MRSHHARYQKPGSPDWTAIKAAIVNLNGDLIQRFQSPSPRTADSLREFVHSALNQTKRPLCGIGIGCKGVIDAESSRVVRLPADLYFLEGSLLTDVISVNVPLHADNDARIALVAEVLWGAGRGRRNVVILTLGTGVGGAAMVDGVILHGATGIAGHFGHMTVDLNGGLCICGNHGCLETKFSSRAIEADYLAHMHRGAVATLPLGAAEKSQTQRQSFKPPRPEMRAPVVCWVGRSSISPHR